MCVRLGYRALFALLLASLWARSVEAQLIEGIDRWADMTVGLSTTKWMGPRVHFPAPKPRPEGMGWLESARWPVRVHAPDRSTRVLRVLQAAELAYDALSMAGFVTSFGDGSGARDLYVVDDVTQPAGASLDATGNFSALDGGRAFAWIDARLPADRVFPCTAQALLAAQLFELDPAESSAMRDASAAYFAELISGDRCEEPSFVAHKNPFTLGVADGAQWLSRLSARQDRHSGTFLFDMWQFARQRTWEGRDLRASPNLMEAIDKALSMSRESFALVAAELSEALAREQSVPEKQWAELPTFVGKQGPPLGVLGSRHLLVQLGERRPGERLRAWSLGEGGGRYTLSALRLDADGNVLSRYEIEPRRNPQSQLSIELDDATSAVLVSVTRFADDGVPDPEAFDVDDVRPVTITADDGK